MCPECRKLGERLGTFLAGLRYSLVLFLVQREGSSFGKRPSAGLALVLILMAT